MGRNQPVRSSLRAATADAHVRVDALFSRFNLADRGDYGCFLQAQAAALLPLERALDAGIAPALGIEWAERRRSTALRHDLLLLGLSEPVNEDQPPITEAAAAFGTIYVLEGSRLGGALLERSVAAGLPRAFLARGAPGLWSRFLDALERGLPSEADLVLALSAARQAFLHFERGARVALAETVR